jgi:hypothetical protein
MPGILDYLNHVDQDANARAAHQQNPQKAMADFGLSQPEQQAMLSGDKEQVAHVLGISSDELPSMEIPLFSGT